MDKRRFLKRILIINMLFVILFNHIQIVGDCFNIVKAANIEVEEIKEDNEDKNSEIEIEEMEEESYEEYENDSGGIEIEELEEEQEPQQENQELEVEELEEEIQPIEKASVETQASINKKVKSEKGLYVQETLSIKIYKNSSNIENAYLELDSLSINGIEPSRVFINKEYTRSKDNHLIIEESLKNNKDSEVNLKYIIDLEYENQDWFDKHQIIGNVTLENTSETHSIPIDVEIEDSSESVIINNKFDFKAENQSLYKGFLRANLISDRQYETNYTTISTVEIDNVGYIDQIIIEDEVDKLAIENEVEDLVGAIKYNQTRISKANYDEIIGVFGFIDVYNGDDFVGTIDSNGEVENDDYVLNYSTDYDKLTFIINNPNKSGTLSIKNNKSIKGNLDIDDNELSNVKAIKITSKEKVVKSAGTEYIDLCNAYNESEISLEETYSKIDLELNKNVFSSERINDVSFKLTIDNGSEKLELFKNPSIEIQLPDVVEDVEIENVYLIHKNGLSLSSWKTLKDETGKNLIKVELNGRQQEYKPGYSVNDTQIIINTKIKTNEIVPDGESAIEYRYTNEASNRIKYIVEGKESEKYIIRHKAKNGLLNEFKLDNINNQNESIITVNGKNIAAELDSNTSSYNFGVNGKIVNNFYDKIENVAVIGRAPSFGVKNSAGEILNNSINLKLMDEISKSDLIEKIYYSPKVNCEVDDESWVEDPENFDEIKSFKMILKDNTLNHGEEINFGCVLNIPEKLGLNQSAYMVYTIEYDYQNEKCKDDFIVYLSTDNGMISENECQTRNEVQSNQENSAKLKVGTRATISGIDVTEGQEIYEGQIIRYSVLVENTSNEVVNNVIINEHAKNGNIYYLQARNESDKHIVYDWYEDIDGTHDGNEIKIDRLMPGEKRIISFEVFARKKENDDVYGIINIKGDGIEEQSINTISGKIVDSQYELELFSSQNDLNNNALKSDSNQDISLRIRNNSDYEKQNINVRIILPKLVSLNRIKASSLKDYIVDYIEQEDKNILLLVVDNIQSKTDLYYTIPLSIANIPLDTLNETISIVARIDENEEEYVSNDYYRIVEQSKTTFDAKISSNYKQNSVVSNGDKVEFNLNVRNIGQVQKSIELGTIVPDGIEIEKIEVKSSNGNTKDIDKDLDALSYIDTFNINVDESINIKVKGTVNSSRLNVGQNELVFKGYSSQFEVEPYVLKVDEKDIVSIDWYEKLDASNDKDSEIVPKKEENNQNETPSRIQEIYTGVGKTSANIDIDIDKYYIPTKVDYSSNNEAVQSSNESREVNNEVEEESDEAEESRVNEDADVGEFEDIELTNQVNTEEISGVAWLDVNRDGIKNDEIYLENVDVYLYKDDVKDENRVIDTKTGKDGTYKFDAVEEGNYYVVFDYDNNRFNTTKYDDNTSSVYELNIDLNNNEKSYAISDKISAGSVNGVNIGLVEKSQIDFEINSYVESITVINQEDVEKMEFEKDNNLPKIEVSRNDISEAIIRVKYVIDIKNNGNIGGYVIQLKDIIPDGFVFEEGQNLNWKLGTDGAIYNSSLSNDRIEPNSNKTISLVLTKEKETQVLGAFSNNVEIVSTSNEMLIEDNNLDNNKDTQDLIISIKTGALTYILFVMLITIILAIALLLLVNKIIENKELKKKVIKILIIIFIVIAVLLLVTHSFALSTRVVDGIQSVNELLGKGENTSRDYEEYKQICEMLDLYKNTNKTYRIDSQDIDSLQQSNKQNDDISELNNESAYGISSIFSVDSNSSSYRTLSNNDVVYTGEADITSKIAFLGYLIENDIQSEAINREDIKYNLARLLYNENKNNINLVTDESSTIKKIIGGSYSLDYDIDEDDSGIYEMMSSKYMEFKNENKTNVVEKINQNDGSIFNIGDGFVGPFYINAPITSVGKYTIQLGDKEYSIGDIIGSKNYLEYYSINDNEWKGIEAEIYYNNSNVGNSDNNGEIQTSIDLSNKNFVIKILNSEVKNDVSQIRIRNTHNEYEATGINFESLNNNDRIINPDITIIRGRQNEINSEQVWKYSSYNVSINNYAYRVYKSENDKITDVIVDTIGSRNEYMSASKEIDPIGVDLKDIIITCVEFNNNGRTVDGFTANINSDSKLTYLGYLDNVPETGVPEIKNNSGSGNWKISNKDSRIITYNGKIESGESVKIYLAYRLDNTNNSNEKISETIELNELISGKENIIELLDASSVVENMEMFETRKTCVDITTSLYSLNGERGYFADFNSGDEIVVRTNIANRAEDYDKYGSIYNVEYSSNYTLDDGRNIGDYFEFNGFSLVPGDFSIKGTDYVERVDNGENGFTYDLRLNLGILPGDDINIYSSYTIKNMDEEKGFTIKPNNELKAVDNRNGDLEVANVNYGPLIRGTDDELKVTDFTLTLSKTVTKVTDKNGNDTEDNAKAEYGDFVHYKLTAKGNGTPPETGKASYVILVLDYSNSMTFSANYTYDAWVDHHGGRCFNANHWTTGSHQNNNGGSGKDKSKGCIDRLDVTVDALSAFTETFLNKHPDNRVALTLFAGNAKGPEAPANDDYYWDHTSKMNFFTNEKSKITSVLTDLNTFSGGYKVNVGASTHFDEGFNRAKWIIDHNTIPADAEVTVVFMTDGDPTLNGYFGDCSQADKDKWRREITGIDQAQVLKDAGISIYGVGLGDKADMDAIGKLITNNQKIQIKDGKNTSDWTTEMNKLADELGSKKITWWDYLNIGKLELVDTLPEGIKYVNNSITSTCTWDNGNITYTNADGVKNNTDINIEFRGEVIRAEKTSVSLVNKVYAKKVTSKAGTILYEEKNVLNPLYHDEAAVRYQIYKATINKYVSGVSRQKYNDKYTKV